MIFTSPDLEPSFQGVPAIEVRPTSPRSIQQRLTTPNSSRDSVPPGELRVCNPDRPKSKDSLFPPSNLTARPVEEILPDGPLTAHSFELQVTEEEEENERQVVPGDDRSPLLLKPCGGRGFYTIIEESQESLSLLFPDCPEPAFSNRYKISEVSVSIEELRPNAEEAARGVLFKRKPLVERLTRHYRPSYSSRKHVCPEPPLPIITASNLIAPPPPPNHQAARVAAHLHSITSFVHKLKARRHREKSLPPIPSDIRTPLESTDIPATRHQTSHHTLPLPPFFSFPWASVESLVPAPLSINHVSPPNALILRCPHRALDRSYFTYLHYRRQRLLHTRWELWLSHRAEVKELLARLGQALEDLGDFEVNFPQAYEESEK